MKLRFEICQNFLLLGPEIYSISNSNFHILTIILPLFCPDNVVCFFMSAACILVHFASD